MKSKIPYYYDTVVVIGIGGSYSGTKAVDDLFGISFTQKSSSARKPILYLGSNLSEKEFHQKLEFLKERHPVFCLISKSGKTLEPNVAFCTAWEAMKERYDENELAERTFVVTDPEPSFLREISLFKKEQIFSIPQNVGGRFSVFSAASLIPLCLAGHHSKEFVRGGEEFFNELEEEKESTLESLLYAPARFLAWQEGKKLELLAYHESSLNGFTLWWQQLFAESEGKNSKGLFPTSSFYSRDLHSVGQYLQEGTPCLFETFLKIGKIQSLNSRIESKLRVPSTELARSLLGNATGHTISDLNQKIMEATQRAHAGRQIPHCTITLEKLDEHSLGKMLAFFQTTCMLSATFLDVNPYNQPGVEAYKSEMRELLSS